MRLKLLCLFLMTLFSSIKSYSQYSNWLGKHFIFTQPNTSFVLINIKICSNEFNTGSIAFNDTIIYFSSAKNECASISLDKVIFDSALVIGKNYKQAINLICTSDATCSITIYNTAEDEGYNVLPITELDSQYYDYHFDKLVSDSALFKSIIAIEDNTFIDIYENENLLRKDTLQKNEILVVERKKIDIFSNKKIAFFSSLKSNIRGSSCIGLCCSEEMYEQVLQGSAHGKNFMLNSIQNKNEYVVVLNSFEDNTCIEINGQFITLQKQEHYELFTTESCLIRSSKKIAVHRFFLSNTCTNNDLGDPEMFQILPIENLAKQSVFYAVNGYFQKYFLNIIIPNESLDSIYFDEVDIQSKFSKLNDFYSVAEFEISNTKHKLESSKGFHAFTYGVTSNFSGPNSAGYNITGNLMLSEYKHKTNKSFESIVLCNEEVYTYHSSDTSSTFNWNDGFVSNHRIISDSGLFIVEVQNDCLNYRYADTVQIKKQNCLCTPNVPQLFSPNNDGINDELWIEYNCSVNNDLNIEIYNRWGKLIYQNIQNNKTWKGLDSNNQICETGTYVYIISYKDDKQIKKTKTGTIYLLK